MTESESDLNTTSGIRQVSALSFVSAFIRSSGQLYPLLTRLQNKWGKTFSVRIGARKLFYLNCPKASRQVLISRNQNYCKTQHTLSLNKILGNGLVTTEGQQWQSRRQIIGPYFRGDKLERMTRLMGLEFEDWKQETWQPLLGKEVNLVALLHRLNLCLVGRFLLGIRDQDSYGLMSKGISSFIDHQSRGLIIPSWFYMFDLLRIRRFKQSVDNMLFQLIKSRMQDGVSADDYISFLLREHQRNPDIISIQAVRDETMTMMAAGHETAASTLFWAFIHLAHDSDLQERLRHELNQYSEVQLNDPGFTLTISLVRHIFLEAMRLYPPSWLQAREATGPDEFSGYSITKGDTVILPVWFLHRDPDLWQDANKFNPDRFIGQEKNLRLGGSYLPFSLGPRSCIGNIAGMRQACMILAGLLKSCRIEVPDPHPPEPGHGVILKTPASCRVIFKAV